MESLDTDTPLNWVRERSLGGRELYICGEKFCTYRVALLPDRSNIKHICPSLGGSTVIRRWMSLLHQLWVELDEVTKQILEREPGTDSQHLKGQAVGLAKAIVIFHKPFFDDGIKAVSAEALKRYKAKKAGEHYETIGLNERRMEMLQQDKYVPANRQPVAAIDPVLAEIQNIPDQHKNVIRNSKQDASAISKLFGISEEAIRRLREGV